MTKRLFFAINLPASLKKKLGKLIHKLERRHKNRQINWVAEENLHITLKFLGDQDEAFIPKIDEIAKRVATGNGSFVIMTQQLGCFPHNREPRIMMLEGHDPSGSVNALARELEAALCEAEIHADERQCHPHITLGRVKDDEGACEIDEKIDEEKIEVASFELMESELGPGGATYKVIGTYPLS